MQYFGTLLKCPHFLVQFQTLQGKGECQNSRLVCHYLETSDFKSTENLRKHARTCWGVETIAAADETGNLCAALEVLKMGQ